MVTRRGHNGPDPPEKVPARHLGYPLVCDNQRNLFLFFFDRPPVWMGEQVNRTPKQRRTQIWISGQTIWLLSHSIDS
jgi:hypothetical protein